EPFLDAGIRLIHHCDGNVMPLIDDMVAAGFSGFQGFQYECGVDIYELRKRRSLRGEEMLILGGLSVTRTLPFGTPDDIRREVDYCLDATDGGRGFFLFTSNVTGVEVPPANLEVAYRYLRAYDPAAGRTGAPITTPPALGITPGMCHTGCA
ncbi:MAG TPA: uroporphyrinogen decarboxylase family protein, partial [Armatimonadota bacterium]